MTPVRPVIPRAVANQRASSPSSVARLDRDRQQQEQARDHDQASTTTAAPGWRSARASRPLRPRPSGYSQPGLQSAGEGPRRRTRRGGPGARARPPDAGAGWRCMVVASGMMLSVVNVSIVNIALPTMADDLGVDVPSISWVVTGFLVTQATLLALAGRAGDLYGRRRIFVAGVLVLCAGVGAVRARAQRAGAGGVPDPPGRRRVRDGAHRLRLRGRAVRPRARARRGARGDGRRPRPRAGAVAQHRGGAGRHARLAQRLLVHARSWASSCWRAPRWCWSSSRPPRRRPRLRPARRGARRRRPVRAAGRALARGGLGLVVGRRRDPGGVRLGAAALALFVASRARGREAR